MTVHRHFRDAVQIRGIADGADASCRQFRQGRSAADWDGKGHRRHLLVQDGDLEYDPNDYVKILEPLVKGEADVVYGSRFMAG